MDGLGRAVVGVWRAHTALDESDGAESSPEVPDRFRKMRSSSSLGSLRMSLRNRLPLRTVQANSLPETSASEIQKEQPKPNVARKLSRSARNSISGMCQVNVWIRDCQSVLQCMFFNYAMKLNGFVLFPQRFQRTREFSREECLVATPGRDAEFAGASSSCTPRLEEAVFRNIRACKELSQTTRTAYGPNGMNKMVINHLEKLFVTNDAATILRELEVQHPAAKMIVMASHMQEQEVGDGTNFVLVFAGALLELAEELLRMGLSVSEVIDGYEKACKKTLEILQDCICSSAKNLHDVNEATALIRTAVMSKQYGNEDFLANLIAQACESGNFNVDNVRVCKILGCGVTASTVLHGMVFKKEAEGDVTSVKDAKIAVFSCPFDCMVTETKCHSRALCFGPVTELQFTKIFHVKAPSFVVSLIFGFPC
ncbi:hypothetical protein XENOCAPTIV_018831 [Xenoophorus captivus]|uniref:T-complex protein 1 subunit theta n=1 Tax=Xenoophorus captivus TaxID=1517983 RepID=A0ABV0QDP0_9TELE